MVIIVTCKNEEDPIKIQALESPIILSLFDFFQTLKGRLLRGPRSNSVAFQTHSRFLSRSSLPARMKKINHEGTRVLTRLYINCSDTQGKQSVVESG